MRKHFSEVHGYRYSKDAIITKFHKNDYLDQHRDLKFFYREYVGEELMYPFKSYTDMKTKYPIQVKDLRFQIDQSTPKKVHLFEQFNFDPPNVIARLFVIKIRHGQIEKISDGNRFIVKDI